MKNTQLCTVAWLLVGLTRSLPGILESDGERLAFTGEAGIGFNASLREITNVNFPWHYFGAGFKLQIGSTEHRLSFVEPNDCLGVSDNLLSKSENFGDLSGRKAGSAWKALLLG